MNIPYKLFKLSLKVLRPPRLLISGIIYDVIVGPPAMGTTIDPLTQTLKPVAFAQGRINAQYVIEGLSVGFFYALGTAGIILLDVSSKSALLKDYKVSCWILAILLLLGFYRMMIVFVRIKLPGYLEFYYQ
ncbi:Oligosaccharyltransferase complex subunit ostc-B [Galdieria sulphuraria]|nr:Oligosaccharyltransferase complex subunit ostc-B [Galdieria sulphuraria]